MSLKTNIIPAAAAIALLGLCVPAAVSAQTETKAIQTSSIESPLTRADLERAFSAKNFATKAEVAELRASLETLRARLNALKAQMAELKMRLGMPQTPPAQAAP